MFLIENLFFDLQKLDFILICIESAAAAADLNWAFILSFSSLWFLMLLNIVYLEMDSSSFADNNAYLFSTSVIS